MVECRIYLCNNSPWVSLVHVVPKEGGFIVIRNEKNELISTRTMIRWRMCIDYIKLNTTTRKDHYPLPFIDQMLDRLARHPYLCFLDGYLMSPKLKYFKFIFLGYF